MSAGTMEKSRINTKLLVCNDVNLKIFLDGFDVLEFLRISELITSHGGIMTNPPDQKTVVLSESETPRGTKSLRFDINWLYDSIQKNQLQDIGNYLLPTAPEENQNSSAEATIKEPEVITIEDDSDVQTKKRKINSEEEEEEDSEAETPEPMQQSESDEEVSEDSSGDSSDARPSSSNNAANEGDFSEMKDAGRQRFRIYPSNAAFESFIKINSRNCKIQMHKMSETPTHRHKDTLKSSPGKKEMGESSEKRRRIKYSVDEHHKMLNYIIENSAFDRTTSLKFWKNCAEEILPDRTPLALKLQFGRYLLGRVEDYVQDADTLEEFKILRSRKSI